MTTTATMLPTSSPALATPSDSSSSAGPPTAASLPTPTHSAQSSLPRPLSRASKNNRLSQYSTTGSMPSRSRPSSNVFPMFPSTLPYAQVRDFAYPAMHPLHYGPPPELSGPPSGLTTPATERRLSDPPTLWDQKMPWDSWAGEGRARDLPPIHFGDGPPYSEDDDLQSPVVSTRHRKQKSSSSAFHSGRGRGGRESASIGAGTGTGTGTGTIQPSSSDDDEGSYFLGTGRDSGERFYANRGADADRTGGGGGGGGGGESMAIPPGQEHLEITQSYVQTLSDNDGYRSGSDDSNCSSSPGFQEKDQSRYSRDYQFTITSPDEEFHGKAVALFDFERENENELPLVEGQIIWVSYRHGQGWLVAEDPKTQESGLVPEQYVRLLRDIEGGMSSLTGEGPASPLEATSPTNQDISGFVPSGHTPSHSISSNGYHQPIVSMFSTSSKDLNPYPTEQLGLQSRQGPPQVVHYHGQRGGSQVNIQVISQLQDLSIKPEDELDTDARDTKDAKDSIAATATTTMTTMTTTTTTTTTPPPTTAAIVQGAGGVFENEGASQGAATTSTER
ncbi:NAP1-binding protein 2 [Escovopsis weberi]|uniref:NAP1-binding protein 2 n=1 Tax=Escovopsis weberi TaxID=150374 RepID=A0A0M8N2B6_ESCWE|nr:NAP1-binding protein 2 [Escovopsis weberi]